MKKKIIYSFKRVFFLIRNEIFSNYSKILTIFGAIAGIILVNMIFSSFVSKIFHSSITNYGGWFGSILFIGGFIYTSNIFRDLHNPQKGIHYLTLPASTLEKFISKLLLSTLGYSLWVIIFNFLLSVIISGFLTILYGNSIPLFNPFNLDIVWLVLNYIIIQSVFLLGSVYFKRSALFKTLLTIFGAFILLILIGITLLRSIGLDINFGFSDLRGYLNDFNMKYLPLLGKIFYFYMLAPLLWIIAFFRLKETEV